jgi:chitinase
MTYDYYGPWRQPDGSVSQNYGYHMAILPSGPGTPNGGLTMHDAIQTAQQLGVPSNKINVGVAAYGRGWDAIQNGTPTYGPFNGGKGGVASKGFPKDWISTDLQQAQVTGRWALGIADYKGLEKIEMGGPSGAGSSGWVLMNDPYMSDHQFLWNQGTGSFFTLDTAKSVKRKGAEVKTRGLSGAILWSIDGDSGTLLNALHQGYGNTPK